MEDPRRIADVEEVPTDGTLLVTIGAGDDRTEVVLTRLGDGTVTAWENHCKHWIDTPLDRGDGALVRGGEIVCQKHGAMFERDTGLCTAGPCEGAVLDPVAVAVRDGSVYLYEPGWTVEHRGPAEPRDRSTRGGLDW